MTSFMSWWLMFGIKKQKVVPCYSGGNIKCKDLDNFSGDGIKILAAGTKKEKVDLFKKAEELDIRAKTQVLSRRKFDLKHCIKEAESANVKVLSLKTARL
jgi:hypothetical protein